MKTKQVELTCENGYTWKTSVSKQSTKIEQIKFEGIDSWNRPVFKSVANKNRFGSVDKLFSIGAAEQEVIGTVTEKDLCFFGTWFGCEPMGTPSGDVVIIKTLNTRG